MPLMENFAFPVRFFEDCLICSFVRTALLSSQSCQSLSSQNSLIGGLRYKFSQLSPFQDFLAYDLLVETLAKLRGIVYVKFIVVLNAKLVDNSELWMQKI